MLLDYPYEAPNDAKRRSRHAPGQSRMRRVWYRLESRTTFYTTRTRPRTTQKDARGMRQANNACVGSGITHYVRPVLGVVVVGACFFSGVFVLYPQWPVPYTYD